MNRQLQLIHQKMGKYFIPFVAIILSIYIFLLCYQHIRPKTYDFQLNQVAQDTILAPVTIEDLEQTRINRERARDSVADIYLYQEDIRIQQLNKIEQYFGLIRNMRNDTYSREDLKRILEEYSDQLQLDQEEVKGIDWNDKKELTFSQLTSAEQDIIYQAMVLNADPIVQELAADLNQRSLQQLFSISKDELSELQSNLVDFVAITLEQELMPSQARTEFEKLRTRINTSQMSSFAKQTTIDFLEHLIKPTMVYSESETNRLKDEAAQQVQESYILQGQVIVQEGHIINQNNMRQLDLFGYLDASANQYLSQIFVILIVIHALVIYYYFTKIYQENRPGEASLAFSAYTIALASALTLIKISQFIQVSGLNFAPVLVPLFILPSLLKAKTNLQVSILVIIFVNLMGIFIISDNDNQTLVTFIGLYYLFSSLLSFLLMPYIDIGREAQRMNLIMVLMWQFLIAVPIMTVLSIPLISDQGATILLMILMSDVVGIIISTLFLPYWEQILSSQAPMTLNQLANLNHPLLKLLIEKAPGSYHHSIMVANLSANAVEAIGGDSLMIRVAAYYHDVGKTVHPLFFVENVSGGIESPHRMVGPDESAAIIIDHVAQGVALLEEYKMPQSIIDVCEQHHGTTLTQYFYYQAKEKKMNISESDFRYPGPIPQSKEIAILMIADSLEAASRTMKEHTQTAIEELVDSIIQGKIDDGQFADCGLTVDELRIVRRSLILGVASMYHTRVEYPK